MNQGNAQAQKQAYTECRKVAPYMLGDYYPLTPYSLELDQWIAWQFNRSEEGDGLVQVFRRSANQETSQTYRLSGLDPAAQYELTNFDVEGTTSYGGGELMEKGLSIVLMDCPGSAVIVYKKK